MIVYLDASVLISLGSIGELPVLDALDGDLRVPETVRAEVTSEPAATALERFTSEFDVPIEAAADVPADRREEAARLLGDESLNGDVHIVAGVLHRRESEDSVGVVSDDRRVRTMAESLGATVTGTVGVVVRAVADGDLDEAAARDLIRRIDSHGLHMTGELREKADDLISDAADEE